MGRLATVIPLAEQAGWADEPFRAALKKRLEDFLSADDADAKFGHWFAYDKLWGTLNAVLFVHPSQLKEGALASEVETATRRLRYGAIGINQWSAVAYALGSTPWGGHPSSTLADIQSGRGWAHNTAMLEGIEKCVVSGPLVSPMRPLWSPLHKTCHTAGRALCEFEAEPDLWRLSKLGYSALRG